MAGPEWCKETSRASTMEMIPAFVFVACLTLSLLARATETRERARKRSENIPDSGSCTDEEDGTSSK
jgi:hypothetical protein